MEKEENKNQKEQTQKRQNQIVEPIKEENNIPKTNSQIPKENVEDTNQTIEPIKENKDKKEENNSNEKTEIENTSNNNETSSKNSGEEVVQTEKENIAPKTEKTEKTEKIEKPKEEPLKQKIKPTETEKFEAQKLQAKKTKSNIIKISVIAIIIFSIMLFSVIFSLLNINNKTILKGISILGIDVGGLTVQEATDKINDAIESRFKDENNTLILKRNATEISVTANTFNSKFDVDSTVVEAYNIGREGNIITNNYTILWTKLFKKEFSPTLYLDEELLTSTITDASSKMEDRVVENSYYVEDEQLTIVRGKAGYIINKEELKNKIYEQINNIHTSYQTIEIPTIYKEPEPINLEKIHSEIYKQPQDAYVEKNPTRVHLHVNRS